MAKKTKEVIAFDHKVATRIKELRIDNNKNQKQFAEDNDIERQTLNRWESTADGRGVSIYTVHRFCKMINITLKDFFDSNLF